MTYRISYDDGTANSGQQTCEKAARTEEFPTEREALRRARELLDDGDHHTVSVDDRSGNVLCGVRLQLKLGISGE